MSKRFLTRKELDELANNFMDSDSDDSSIEPFPGSDSDSYRPSDSSEDDSDDDFGEPARVPKCKQRLVIPSCSDAITSQSIDAPPFLSEINQIEPEAGSSGMSDSLETPAPAVLENGEEWGPIARIYKAIPTFTLSSGIKPEVAALLANASPGQFYEAIVDDSIISYITDQTNHYASCLLLETDVSDNSRYHNWEPATKTEIKHFLGLVAWMGIVKLPTLADYWSTDPLLNLSFPRSVLSRNRFEILLRTIHFADNNQAIAGDKLAKIKPLLEKLLKNYKDLYTPKEYVCVDETMLPYRGRLSIKQYIKSKRHKYGIKLFKLCSGAGYTYNIKIYAGKENGERVTPEAIVTFLTQDIIGVGRTLVTDNWYTSLPLAKRMLDSDTHLIGTIRKNRKGLPKEVVNKKLKKGEVAAMENKDGITVLKWKDQRDVLILSTKHDDEMVEKNRTRIPKVIIDYNQGKSSVDLSDQMGAYSNPLRRSVKWYRKIAFELLLTTSMVNAFTLYKNVTGSNIKITQFKKEVIRYLVNSVENENIDKGNEPPTKRRRIHTLKRKDGESKHKTRRCCKHCYKKNNELHGRKYATNRTLKVDTYCDDCEGKPFLCLTCFNEIHQE